ncbi:MAG TPA: MFS transporter [bacterium]|nr:MFS transporter [bacterium]
MTTLDTRVRALAADAARRGAPGPGRVLAFNNALSAITNGTWYVIGPFIPLYLGTLGASLGQIGLVVGLAGIVPLLIAVPSGAVADAYGPAVVAVGSVVAYAAAAVVLAAVHGVWAVAIAYTLLSGANIGFALSAQAVVASVSAPRDRLANFGYYSLWSSGGAVLGPIVGGAVAGGPGYVAAFVLAGVLMVPCLFLARTLRAVRAPSRQVVSLTGGYHLVGTILRYPGIPAVLLISFLVVAGQQLQQSFFPVYLSRSGLSQGLIGIVFAVTSLSSMLVRSLLAPGARRLGMTGLVLTAVSLMAWSLGITPQLREFWLLAGAGALMGAGTGLGYPLTMNLMTAPVPPELQGVAFGVRQAVQRVATVVSPIAFGAIIAAYGLGTGFTAGAIMLVAALPIIARVAGPLLRRPGPP